MNIKIDIIMGLLSSGKTSFINSIFHDNELQNETIVIIQDESGHCEINFSDLIKKNNNIIIENDLTEEISILYIENIVHKYSPDRIFIELNGMKNSNSIINIFNDKYIKKICKIDDIITIIDAKNFHIFFRNMTDIISAHIFNSETIILNNANDLNKKEFANIKKEIKNINETANLIEHISTSNMKEISHEEYRELNNDNKFFILKNLLYVNLIIFLFIFFITLSLPNSRMHILYFDKFQVFYTVFISILIQGIPFILIGSFISAIIQICMPKDIFIRIFPKNIFLSCIIAAFAGLLFPICDCGTIPVVRGLLKKKIPLSAGITFMLAAPIVNPIAIISTIYAFQGVKSVVIYRLTAGIIIAILVGLIMHFFTNKDEDILENSTNKIRCDCDFCNDNYDYSKSTLQKVKAVFIHAGDEFFNIGKFMIIGTFLSSIFQSIVSVNNNMYISNDNKISLIVMILSSFLLSVCSTSDAFIAKGFIKQFSINSVMGFLVVGPMLDIKNTIMLLGSFKKKFVLKLIFIILIISFCILINLPLI